MTSYTVIKHYLDTQKIEILGQYTNKSVARDNILVDIDAIKAQNRLDSYDILVNSDNSSIGLVKRCYGFFYNSKQDLLKYIICETSDSIIAD